MRQDHYNRAQGRDGLRQDNCLILTHSKDRLHAQIQYFQEARQESDRVLRSVFS
jgi:hypothetical protein